MIPTVKVIGGVGEKKSNSGTQWYQHERIYQGNVAITVTTVCNPYYEIGEDMNNLRIRKLTPKECGRLQGVRDEDIDKMSKNQSNASLYHLFGDSICIYVLMYLFSEMI